MRRSLPAAPVLALALALAACGPTTPAPLEVTKPAPAKAAAEPAKIAEAAPRAEPAAEPRKREPPLTPEEIELIEADPNTLTPELNRKRAHALRRKILQNPDSPQAQELERIRREVESGALVPTLPGRPNKTANSSLKLEARAPAEPAAEPEKKAP